MSRNSRAQQFLPFDALKGLQKALRLAEYENEAIKEVDLSDDAINMISNVLNEYKKTDVVKLNYFEDGHIFEYVGLIKLNIYNQSIQFSDKRIDFKQLRKIEIIT